MKKYLVAVVGRPNVGKSTFFNKICGKRISIVKDEPGVTRDRVYADAEWCGKTFTLIDTGGLELDTTDEMYGHIKKQAEDAIELADIVLFFTDAKEGPVASEHDIAKILRKTRKPVILVVNKLDNFEMEKVYDFYSLGLGEPFPISSEQGKGLGDLLDEITKHIPDHEDESDSDSFKIAVVGKPNVGKSSLVNRLLGFERVIVSDIAGTTRDAIDTDFDYQGEKFTIIDTAGLRRKKSIEFESVESYGVMRSLAAVRRADAVLIVMDASEPITEQDVKVAGFVHEQGKPSVVVMNKWDVPEKDTHTIEVVKKQLDADLAFMSYYKSVFISAKTGQRVEKVIELAKEVYENASRRVPTGLLNDVIFDAVSLNEPPTHLGRKLKIKYSTQPETNPPRFVLFVNDETLVHFSYRRYLENNLRRAFDFSGTPIRLFFHGKKEDK